MTISFWATWYTRGSWSRIIDFAIGQDNHNILIATRGGSADVLINMRTQGGNNNEMTCSNTIEERELVHWAFSIDNNGAIIPYKNG